MISMISKMFTQLVIDGMTDLSLVPSVPRSRRSVSYETQTDSRGQAFLVAKFTELNWNTATANGKKICFTLNQANTCKTLSALAPAGGALQYAYFSGNADNNRCCGTNLMSYPFGSK